MADMMTFPDTVEEFMEEYKLVDTEQVYTNGTELVPIFRMKQWFEHEAVVRTKNTVASNDCISRRDAIDVILADKIVGKALIVMNALGDGRLALTLNDACDRHIRAIEQLPSAQPERKKGKWIEVNDYYNRISGRCSICDWKALLYETDVVGMDYCPNCGADMRGGLDEVD